MPTTRARRRGDAGGEAPATRQAKRSRTNNESDPVRALRGHRSPIAFVDDTGIEPVTSSVSGKRATAAPIVQDSVVNKVFEVETGFEPVYTALQAVASPLGHSTTESQPADLFRANDRVRTGDLNLGKVALYQLSYVRISLSWTLSCSVREQNSSALFTEFETEYPGCRRRRCAGAKMSLP
jgi:hypothetical protein